MDYGKLLDQAVIIKLWRNSCRYFRYMLDSIGQNIITATPHVINWLLRIKMKKLKFFQTEGGISEQIANYL